MFFSATLDLLIKARQLLIQLSNFSREFFNLVRACSLLVLLLDIEDMPRVLFERGELFRRGYEVILVLGLE